MNTQIRDQNNWYETREVNEGIWAIDERGTNIMYLVYRDEKCLLIDTGWGMGDLPGLVKSLCPLPLIVVNSHGHPDHTFGNGLFSSLHIHGGDLVYVKTPPATETRQWILDNAETVLTIGLPDGFEFDRWAVSVPEMIYPIEDGHSFDLGNRTLEVIALPGHSQGSVCFLDRAARTLFVGDSIHNGTIWLQLEESLPLNTFHKNLQRIQTFSDHFDALLPAHGSLDGLPQPKKILDDLVNGIQLILAGEITGETEETFAGNGLRCDFGSCSILYRPDRLLSKA